MAINIDTYAYSDTKIPICINGEMIECAERDKRRIEEGKG